MTDMEFSLPAKVTDLSIVPDDLRDFYRQSNEGNYYVRVDPKKITGVQEETTRRMQALVSENERLKSEVSKFKDIDLEDYNKLREKREEILSSEAIKNGEVESIRRQIEASAAEKIAKANRDRDLALSIAQSERLTSEFDKAFERAGVIEDEHTRRLLRKDLLDYVVPQVDFDNRRIDYEIREATPGVGGHRDALLNDEGKPMRLADLVTSRRAVMPWAFAGSRGDGGGAGGGANPLPISAASLEGKRIHEMSPAEKAQLYSRIGANAYNQRLRNETRPQQGR